jgi:polygalacturonase
MSRTPQFGLLAASFLVLGILPVCRGDSSLELKEAIISRIRPPNFPARDFPITDFGAAESGDCTVALAKAITECHNAAGGRVVVPPGTWETKAVHLKSNVNLHISEGATLRFKPEPAGYLPVVLTRFEGIECLNYSPLIYAFEQENVAVTGKGTLDGSANWQSWWSWNNKSEGEPTRQVTDRKLLDEQGTSGVPVTEAGLWRRSFLAPQLHSTLPLQKRAHRGRDDYEFANVADPPGALHQCHGQWSDCPQSRSKQ